MPRRKKEKPWSYITGTKGLNRVRVYERRPGGPIQVEFYTPKRIQQSLKTVNGAPVLNRDHAIEIAHRMSESQRRKREARTALELFGRPEPHTLRELLDALHKAREKRWSAEHKKFQKRARAFWLKALGAGRELFEVTPAEVEQIAAAGREAEQATARWEQKRLRYIKDAFYYAWVKLKWVDEKHNLSGVDLPEHQSTSRAYTSDEALAIAWKGGEVDPRCAAVVWIALDTGRRLNAIRNLRIDDLSFVEGRAVLQFDATTDKARKSGVAVVSTQATAAIRTLLAFPAVQASRKLLPSGDLNQTKAKKWHAVSAPDLLTWLHEAEAKAGVPTVENRGYHGFKRRFATDAMPLDHEAASKQAGTRKDTLSERYVQDELPRKIRLVEALERARTAP